MSERALKVFDQTFTTLHPSFGAFNDPSCDGWDKASFALCRFRLFRGLRRTLKADFRHELGIHRL